MSATTISNMDPSGPLTGTELLEIVQGGNSRKVTSAELANLADSSKQLMAWALTSAFRLVSSIRDENGVIVTANIVWPDGIGGVFTTDIASTEHLGAIDAWHATYLSPLAKTVIQPAVTRDANGAVIAQPAITIQ